MDCPNCKTDCCNKSFSEIIHGAMSLSYCVLMVEKGNISDELVERMRSQVSRIDKALKHCIRSTCE